MPDANKEQAGEPVSEGLAEGPEIVRSMGLVFNNTSLYGADHSVTAQSMKDSYGIVSKALENCDEIAFNLTEEGLLVNGGSVELKNPLMKAFVNRLHVMGLNSFAITKGITEDKFEELVNILNTKPDQLKQSGGFAATVKQAGLDNVRAKTVVYKQITEDEVVVSKDKAEQADTAEGDRLMGEVTAFLKGDSDTDTQRAVKGLKSVSSDAGRLADLIVETARKTPETSMEESTEELGRAVADYLRKAFDGMMNDPSANTQKGKKQLEKTLSALQEELCRKLQEMSGDDREAAEAVSDAAEELGDELRIDSLASEYVKKRKGIEKSEHRILRYIKAKGLERIEAGDLPERLGEGGLSPEEWRGLVMKSGAVNVGDFAGEGKGLAAVGQLASLLAGMQERVREAGQGADKIPPDELHKVLADVDREITGLVVQTERKITDLINNVRADEEAESAESPGKEKAKEKQRISRRELLETLAEIVQELCQPLSVISCSVDMLTSGSLGSVSDQQKEMLALAADNSQRVRKLIDKLLEIAGVPKTLKPDEKIQSSLY
ncbi:MAG: histidine kinase dimerization/phospho-acceptor domain-containing protein [Kiritimatiellia bacterium]